MTKIQNVKLEILRSGPAHNQLLSPLTLYYAICGREGGITIKFPFEHRQLLNRLSRLRYVTKTGAITSQQRESEVRELGEIVGKVLGQIPTLVSELAHAGSTKELVHLRLSMSSYELALIPYELAIGTDGFPASGSPLFLQSHLPVTLTREVRHGQPLPVNWNREPRILFVSANPDGYDPVPLRDHLNALRRAIAPWVTWQSKKEDRIKSIQDILTIIPNASLEQLRDACLETAYTHIHILAHGDAYEEAGEQHFGVVLNKDNTSGRADIISGERLSIALAANDTQKARPSLVSLSTCDSGNVNTVMTPGGSIAHALHAGGIPWVVASQFPLWMRASSLATETLFSGIFEGADPRYVLYKLRQRLRTDSAGTHDWASIVAYSTIPADFDQQVITFREQQLRRMLNVKFAIADDLAKHFDTYQLPDEYTNLETLFDSIRSDHDRWLIDLANGVSTSTKSEIFGVRAAAEKRMGLLFGMRSAAEKNKDNAKQDLDKSHDALQQSLNYYKKAFDIEPLNFWVMTQFLSMKAVLSTLKQTNSNRENITKNYNEWWIAAKQIAKWKRDAASGREKAWACGSLLELEMLGVIYNTNKFDMEVTQSTIALLSKDLISSTGSDHFPIQSTQRQLKRYFDPVFCQDKNLQALAATAINIFKTI